MSLKLVVLSLFAGLGVSCPQTDAGESGPPYRFLRYDEDYRFLSDSLGQGGETGKIGEDHRNLAPLAFEMAAGPNFVRQLLRHVSLQLCQERLIARVRFAKFFPGPDNPKDVASWHFGTRKTRDQFV